MIQLPQGGKWTQTNKNNKTGSMWYSKNLNFDKEGYIKLSPRSINIFDNTATTPNLGSTNFAYPTAFGRYSEGTFRLATTNEPFDINISNTAKTIAEDGTSNNPNLTTVSHGVWWQNAWHVTTAQNLRSNTAGTWSGDLISNLSSTSKRHYLAVFKNKQSLCVSDGNTVKLYDTSYVLQKTLTIPSDFEVIGLAYNNYKMAVITRLGSDSAGQNGECYFFTWDGSSTEAESGIGMGAIITMCVFPYKSSFVTIDSLGRLLYYNGGGFQELATFPFYSEQHRWGDLLNFLSYGDNIVVDGDLILINIGFNLDQVGKKGEAYLQNNPSGIWCYDPSVGLYHRTSPSISQVYLHTISQANVNTTTDVFTTSSTIPATGNPVLLTSGTVGGLSNGTPYYVIKLSSTTFSLAETQALAEAGTAIDITSADTNQYLWLYDLKDYGTTYSTATGAIGLYDRTRLAYQDYIFGGNYLNTALSSKRYLCSNVPFLKNIGYGVLPRIFLPDVINNTQKIVIKHAPLKTEDKIIIKVKRKDVLGLPTISPNSVTLDELTWIETNRATTSTDLSEALTLMTNSPDDDIECELIAGVGAGQLVKVTRIQYSSGTYTVTFEDDIIGVTAGDKSYFVIDNWTKKGEVNADNQDDGVYTYTIDEKSKSVYVKVILEGYNTTIEDLQIINTEHKPSK